MSAWYDQPTPFYVAGYDLPDYQNIATGAATIEEAHSLVDEWLVFTQEVRIYDWPAYEAWLDSDYTTKKPDPLFIHLNEVACEWEWCSWIDSDAPVCGTFFGSRYDADKHKQDLERAFGDNCWIGRVENA